jgi:hypothetical protein
MSTATSASERAALAYFATLPCPVALAQSFAPLLSIHHHDGASVELEGRPDALCTQHQGFTFIESNSGALNSLACCRFQRHHVKVENGVGRNQWQQEGSSAESSSSRQ